MIQNPFDTSYKCSDHTSDYCSRHAKNATSRNRPIVNPFRYIIRHAVNACLHALDVIHVIIIVLILLCVHIDSTKNRRPFFHREGIQDIVQEF